MKTNGLVSHLDKIIYKQKYYKYEVGAKIMTCFVSCERDECNDIFAEHKAMRLSETSQTCIINGSLNKYVLCIKRSLLFDRTKLNDK
jgi:hypothetical protein